jgi:ceramide glucosyltransferase
MFYSAAFPLAYLFAAGSFAGFAQMFLGVREAQKFARQNFPAAVPCPGVTILKPLHGDEPLLEAALQSFCDLDWPHLQILCGVQNPDDPAIAVVTRLRAKNPHIDIDLVIDNRTHGHNRKISNLINMLPKADHKLLVISDSDMHAPPNYLQRVTASLLSPGVGLVTTLYTGKRPRGGMVTALAASHIAQIFIPGALLARKLGRQDCLGATMALTRDILGRVGGFERLLPYVADDAMLGKYVRELGLAVALAPTIPATTIHEDNFAGLWAHELRWARTVRSVEPAGFAASIVQLPMVFALLASCALPQAQAIPFLLGCFLLRAMLGRAAENALGASKTSFFLGPIRDVLSAAIWLAAHFGNRVSWRGKILTTLAAPRELAGAGLEGQ